MLYHPCNLNPSTYKKAVFGQSGEEETVGVEVPVSYCTFFHCLLGGDYREHGSRIFLEVHSERIVGNRHKLHQEKF